MTEAEGQALGPGPDPRVSLRVLWVDSWEPRPEQRGGILSVVRLGVMPCVCACVMDMEARGTRGLREPQQSTRRPEAHVARRRCARRGFASSRGLAQCRMALPGRSEALEPPEAAGRCRFNPGAVWPSPQTPGAPPCSDEPDFPFRRRSVSIQHPQSWPDCTDLCLSSRPPCPPCPLRLSWALSPGRPLGPPAFRASACGTRCPHCGVQNWPSAQRPGCSRLSRVLARLHPRGGDQSRSARS